MNFRKTSAFAIPLVLIALLLAACGGESAQHKQYAPNGDLQETTKNIATLPTFLDNQHELIQQAYRVAADHKDLLDWIPCYCGCGEVASHKNNKNCFIKEVMEDGTVVWDDHGTRCNICIETAVLSAKMQQEGKSAKEIRAWIDENYNSSIYAKPTDTQMPM